MKDTVQKLTESRNLFGYACSETIYVAKACRLPIKYRNFIEIEMDQSCVTGVNVQMIFFYDPQMLRRESYINGMEYVFGVLPRCTSRQCKLLRCKTVLTY